MRPDWSIIPRYHQLGRQAAHGFDVHFSRAIRIDGDRVIGLEAAAHNINSNPAPIRFNI